MPHSDVDTYLNRYDGETRKRLDTMREIVKRESPEAVEGFSYGLVGYKLNGKPLVYFGGFTKHIGLYATPNGHEKFKVEFEKYRKGKGSVQLPFSEPLPIDLIKKVIRYRITKVSATK